MPHSLDLGDLSVARVPKTGDIYEVPTPRGFGYVQYTHRSREYGYLIRVLPGLYVERPKDMADLVAKKENYFVYYPLSACLRVGAFAWVGKLPIPEDSLGEPIMRLGWGQPVDGRVLNWWIIDGDKRTFIDRLTEKEKRYSFLEICSHGMLVYKLCIGWRPETARENDPNAPTGQDEIPEDVQKWVDAMSDPETDEVKHYLYFPSRKQAVEAERTLTKMGFARVKTQRSGDPGKWLVLVTKEGQPARDSVDADMETLEEVVRNAGGVYDGHEISVGHGL